jgi:hypothetical protein
LYNSVFSNSVILGLVFVVAIYSRNMILETSPSGF